MFFFIFGQLFVKNAKMTLEHFFDGQNKTKFENRENAEIPGIGVKRVIFDLQNIINSVILQDIYLQL